MAQHDYIISNATFPNVRADINSVLSAISTNNSGTSAPTTQYAGQFWIDTTSSTWTLYIHDGSDDIQFATIDTSANTVNFIDSELGDNSVTTSKIADANVTSAKLSYPLTTFSSTGIDDNATSTAITINSSEQVGIGETSPLAKVHIKQNDSGVTPDVNANGLFIENNANAGLTIGSSTTGFGIIYFGDSEDNNVGRFQYSHSDNTIRTWTNGSERMRIDSSGRLLVGKTSDDNNSTGCQVEGDGTLSASRNGFAPLILNRQTSNGIIAEFRKDGTSQGVIGTTGNFYIADNSGYGFSFDNGGAVIYPCNSSGTVQNNVVNLGHPSYKWKDLYLGGGLYVGGTGTANKLDDYEEGDWTPGYVAGSGTPVYSVRAGSYTKVGRQVTITGAVSGARGSLSGDVKINGLPFTCGSASKFSNSVSLLGANWNTVFSFKGKVNENDTTLSLYQEDTDNTSFVGVNQGNMRTSSASENYVQFTITYFTD